MAADVEMIDGPKRSLDCSAGHRVARAAYGPSSIARKCLGILERARCSRAAWLKSSVPPELHAALDGHPGAAEFFATLNSQNRYAVLFLVQTAIKPETKVRKAQEYAAMLARHETFHPIMAKKRRR